MAVTRVYYHILKEASKQGIFPKDGSLLELGEANHYGDLALDEIEADIKAFVADAGEQQELIARLKNTDNPDHAFDIVKVIYRSLFGTKNTVAVDLHGTDSAIKSDLNEPLQLDDGPFDITINNGTAEHVFNIAQVFKTMHEQTAANGIMIHEGPFTGWYNHGFYNLQPTLFYDIAAANDYQIIGFFCCRHLPPHIMQINSPHALLEFVDKKEIPDDAVLIVMFRKNNDKPFQYPMQGYYEGRLDEAQVKAWETRAPN